MVLSLVCKVHIGKMEVLDAPSLQNNSTYGQVNTALRTNVSALLVDFSIWQGIILFLCLSWGVSSVTTSRRIRVAGAPVHGYWSWFEPTWLLQFRYAKDAHKVIVSGYHKVCISFKSPTGCCGTVINRVPQYKDSPFVLRRQDHDITILPTKYVSELRNIPTAKLGRARANFLVSSIFLFRLRYEMLCRSQFSRFS